MSGADGVDPGRCPLCGGLNGCAVQEARSTGGNPGMADCWCMHTPVAPAALARVPTEARGRACLCPRCARLTSSPTSSTPA